MDEIKDVKAANLAAELEDSVIFETVIDHVLTYISHIPIGINGTSPRSHHNQQVNGPVVYFYMSPWFHNNIPPAVRWIRNSLGG